MVATANTKIMLRLASVHVTRHRTAADDAPAGELRDLDWCGGRRGLSAGLANDNHADYECGFARSGSMVSARACRSIRGEQLVAHARAKGIELVGL